MASSGLFLSFGHGDHQMLGSNSQRLLDPEHGKNAKVSITRWTVINALDSSPRGGGSPGGLFIGAVRGSGNNVQTTPLITLFTQSVQS
jgi:hypothetical protein